MVNRLNLRGIINIISMVKLGACRGRKRYKSTFATIHQATDEECRDC